MTTGGRLPDPKRGPSLFMGIGLTVALIAGLIWATSAIRSPSRSATPDPKIATPGDTGEPSEVPTLIVSDVTLVGSATTPSEAIGRASLMWSGSMFPGVVKCSFAAYDVDGNQVGSYSDIFAVLDDHSTVPVEIDTSDTASRVTGGCGDRLDTGQPYEYQISNVDWGGEPTSVSLRFDATWAGPAQAGAVSCVATATDAGGSVVGSERFTLFILEGEATGMRVAPIATTSSATDVALRCQPFVS